MTTLSNKPDEIALEIVIGDTFGADITDQASAGVPNTSTTPVKADFFANGAAILSKASNSGSGLTLTSASGLIALDLTKAETALFRTDVAQTWRLYRDDGTVQSTICFGAVKAVAVKP